MKVLMQPEMETKTNKNGEVEVDIVEYYVYIPFVRDIVPVVDIDQGLIEITPPAGLLDLKQKVGIKENANSTYDSRELHCYLHIYSTNHKYY